MSSPTKPASTGNQSAEVTVATLRRHGEGPGALGRMVLADGAAEPGADSVALLRIALDALAAADCHVGYLTTPANFLSAQLPMPWLGTRGWRTEQTDFDALITVATAAAMRLVTSARASHSTVHYLSLGVDLFPDGRYGEPHAECSILYDNLEGRVIGATGKSYPTTQQQNDLIRNSRSTSHITVVPQDRVAVLVCHDLTAYSPRGRATRSGLRSNVAVELEEAIGGQEPTIALHQAHTVDSPGTWAHAWSAFRRENHSSLRGWATAFRYRTKDNRRPSRPLSVELLRSTHGGSASMVDVVLSNPETARRLSAR